MDEELVLKTNEVGDAELLESCAGYEFQCFPYTIQPGDTLSEIAVKYHVNMWRLAQINNIANPDRIRAGQVIYIPYYYY